MPPEDNPPRPFRRTFAILGALYLVALAGLLVAAGLGWAPPALLGPGAAWLLAGGAVTVLAVAVPLTLFAMHRYTRAASDLAHGLHSEARHALQAAHDNVLQHVDDADRLNEAMHRADRERAATIEERLGTEHEAIQQRALAADMDAMRQTLLSRHEQLETNQETHWIDHARTHAIAEDALTTQHAELASGIDAVAAKLDALEERHARLDASMSAAKASGLADTQELRDSIKALRLSEQQDISKLSRRLASAQPNEDQFKQWAQRVNEHTDHELARFRHKIQHQLDQFESRGVEDLHAAERRSRDEAAILAEDIVRQRLAEHDEAQETRLNELKSWMDAQWGGFLAGQLAQRTDAEARLAAIGATRGVKVQANEAYELTSHAPFGRIYPIADVEGIGNKTAYGLQRMGILDTEHLWHADVPELSAELAVTPRQIRQWQSQAELMAIDGIGPQWGELLAASGVVSIGHLANLHARELLELIQAHGHAYRSRLHKGAINLAKAEHFIEQAREHRPEAVVHV